MKWVLVLLAALVFMLRLHHVDKRGNDENKVGQNAVAVAQFVTMAAAAFAMVYDSLAAAAFTAVACLLLIGLMVYWAANSRILFLFLLDLSAAKLHAITFITLFAPGTFIGSLAAVGWSAASKLGAPAAGRALAATVVTLVSLFIISNRVPGITFTLNPVVQKTLLATPTPTRTQAPTAAPTPTPTPTPSYPRWL